MKKRSANRSMDSSTPKKTASTPKKSTEQHEEGIYFIEPDTLECVICFMPFEAQVFMCKNGHPACADCCISMNRKCSSCSESIGDIRCRPLEKVLAGMTSPCKFKKYGCQESVRYTERRNHEEACPCAPFHCPLDGCSYYGLLLYNHIQDDHASDAAAAMGCLRGTTVTLNKSMPFRVLLHRGGGRVFLLLNGGDVLSGRSLSVVCIGPCPTAGNAELEYKLKVSSDEPGALSLSASGSIPCVRRLDGFQARGFLFVPDAYWGSSGTVSVTVHV